MKTHTPIVHYPDDKRTSSGMLISERGMPSAYLPGEPTEGPSREAMMQVILAIAMHSGSVYDDDPDNTYRAHFENEEGEVILWPEVELTPKAAMQLAITMNLIDPDIDTRYPNSKRAQIQGLRYMTDYQPPDRRQLTAAG